MIIPSSQECAGVPRLPLSCCALRIPGEHHCGPDWLAARVLEDRAFPVVDDDALGVAPAEAVDLVPRPILGNATCGLAIGELGINHGNILLQKTGAV